MLDDMIRILKGRKTYLISAAMALSTFIYGMGWLDEKSYMMIMGALASGNFAALRAGVGK